MGAGCGSKLGARYVAELRRTVLNGSEPTYVDRSESCFCRSGHFLIYVDTVGVTGSIPVSPTRHKRWSDGLLVITTDGPFLRCGSIFGSN